LSATWIDLASNFSTIPWGSQIRGEIRASSILNACKGPLKPITDKDGRPVRHLILFAERGGCTFVTKAFNGQAIGAKMIIIGNNRQTESLWRQRHGVLVDDKSGRKINIPVGMVSTKVSAAIKKYLAEKSGSGADGAVMPVWATIKF
jgi:hypothetical protein